MQIRDLELFWRELILSVCCETEDALKYLGDERQLAQRLAGQMRVAGDATMRASGDFPPFETLQGPDYPHVLKKALFWAGGPSAGSNILPPIGLTSQRLIGCGLVIQAVLAEFEAYYPERSTPGDLPNPATADKSSVQKYLSDVRQVLDAIYAERDVLSEFGGVLINLGHEVGRADEVDQHAQRRTMLASLVRQRSQAIYAQFETLVESTTIVPHQSRGTRTPPTLIQLAQMDGLESRRLATAVDYADMTVSFVGEDPTLNETLEACMGGLRIAQMGSLSMQSYDFSVLEMIKGFRSNLDVYKTSLAFIPRLAQLEQDRWDSQFVRQWLRNARSGREEPVEVHEFLGRLRRERIGYHQAIWVWLETMRRYGQRRLRDTDFQTYIIMRALGPRRPPDTAVSTSDMNTCYVIQRRLALGGLAFPAYQHVAAHLLALQQSLADREALYLAIRAARAGTTACEASRVSNAAPPTPPLPHR